MGLRGLALGEDRFYCRDGLLEVWLAMLVDRMEAEPRAPWQESLVREWRSQVTVRFNGVMTAELDRFVDGPQRREALAALCVEVRDSLVRGELVLGPLARRVIGFGPTGASRDEGVRRVADAMLWLLGRRADGRPRPARDESEVSESMDLWWTSQVR